MEMLKSPVGDTVTVSPSLEGDEAHAGLTVDMRSTLHAHCALLPSTPLRSHVLMGPEETLLKVPATDEQ